MNDTDTIATGRLLRTATRAAREAGLLQKRHFDGDDAVVLHSTAHDLKIETDLASERIIVDTIRSQYPGHAVLSEESGLTGGDSSHIWIIDPLDGTVNFSFRQPYFCTCIACYRTPPVFPGEGGIPDISRIVLQGHPLVGVVHSPLLGWMFCAAKGGGATLNGRQLQRGEPVALKDAVVGISYGSCETVMQQMEKIAAILLRKSKKIRTFGASGLDLALVAKGSLSAQVLLNISAWDFAAARVILEESGIRFEARPNSLNGWQVLAAPASLFASLKAIVDDSLADGFLPAAAAAK